MTIRYLKRGNTVALSSSGIGKVNLSPDTGQYWIPRIIRVGSTLPATLPTSLNGQSQLICQLFHGGTGDVGADAFVDITGAGTGDVTSVLNGTLIQPGEFLTASWTPWNPFLVPAVSTAYLEVIGLTADSITEATAALASAVPGPGFSVPVSYPMLMPRAGDSGAQAAFANPGPGNTVPLIVATGGTAIYLYSLEIQTSPPVNNASGNIRQLGNPSPTLTIAFFDPFANAGPAFFTYNGLRIFSTTTTGLEFFQLGTAAANAIQYNVTMVYRNLLF